MAERIPISRVLGALLDEATAERVSLGWLMNRLGERSFDIILRNEEFRAVAQLCRGLSPPGSRAASPAAQEVDVALAGKIEVMAVPADERAGRSG